MAVAASRDALIQEILLREEAARRRRDNKFLSYYPETGPLRRELYPKHVSFFKTGQDKE